jgi:hypothetical protein
MFTSSGKYMADMGMLVYDRYDSRGANVERIEKFFPIPPI